MSIEVQTYLLESIALAPSSKILKLGLHTKMDFVLCGATNQDSWTHMYVLGDPCRATPRPGRSRCLPEHSVLLQQTFRMQLCSSMTIYSSPTLCTALAPVRPLHNAFLRES